MVATEKQTKPVNIRGVMLLLAAILLLGLILYINLSPKKTYEDLSQEAQAALDQGDYQKAYDILKEAQETDGVSNDQTFYADIAQAAYLSGDKESAKNYAKEGEREFKINGSKDLEASIIIDMIENDTLIVDPLKNVPEYTVPEEQYSKEGFQG